MPSVRRSVGFGPVSFPASIARTDELSTMARARSNWPRRRSSASSVSLMRCQGALQKNGKLCTLATGDRRKSNPEAPLNGVPSIG
jgi:hypothetical protein